MKEFAMINLLQRPIRIRLWIHRYRFWLVSMIIATIIFAVVILGTCIYNYWNYKRLGEAVVEIQTNSRYIQLQQEVQRLKDIECGLLKSTYGNNRHIVMVLLDSANQLNYPQQRIHFTKVLIRGNVFSIDGDALNIQVYDEFKHKLMGYLKDYDVQGKQEAPKNSKMVGFHLEGNRRNKSHTN